jgi:hypothetical protein
MIEKGPTTEKNEEKGGYEGKNEGNKPSKKVPRAYESLNPALLVRPILRIHFTQTLSVTKLFQKS